MHDTISATMKGFLATLAIAVLVASADASGGGGGGHAAPAADAGPAVKAVALGEYLISDFRAVEGAKLRISFELYLDADGEHLHRLREMVDAYKHRIRSEVIVAVRICEQSDFEQADLNRMRRRILARLKRALPELPVERLYIGAFQYFNE